MFRTEHNESHRSDPGLIISPSRNVDIGAIVCVSVRLNACSIQMSLVQTMRCLSLTKREALSLQKRECYKGTVGEYG